MREVSGPIIAIALALCAVFVPIAFVSGLTGQFYRQFALTIAISTVISAFNSLTLSPALAALLLRPHDAPKDWLTRAMDRVLGWFFRWFNRTFKAQCDAIPGRGRARAATARRSRSSSTRCCSALTWFAFQRGAAGLRAGAGQAVPRRLRAAARTAPRSTAPRRVIRRMSRDRHEDAGREGRGRLPGPFDRGLHQRAQRGHRVLRSRRVREPHVAGALGRCHRRGDQSARSAASRTRSSLVFPPPPVNGLGTIGGFKLQIEDRGGLGDEALYKAMKAMQAKAWQTPELAGVLLELPDQRAAALRRCRPRQGEAHGRRAHRRLRHHADQPRLALRQRLQPVRPHLPRGRAGRRTVPLARRGHRAAEDAQQQGRDGAARLGAARRCRASVPTARSATTRSRPPT